MPTLSSAEVQHHVVSAFDKSCLDRRYLSINTVRSIAKRPSLLQVRPMSSTLNKFSVLQTALYSDDPSFPGTVAGFISGLRHVAAQSPALLACIVINVVVVYYVLSFVFATKVIAHAFTYKLQCSCPCRFAIHKSATLVTSALSMGQSVFSRIPSACCMRGMQR